MGGGREALCSFSEKERKRWDEQGEGMGCWGTVNGLRGLGAAPGCAVRGPGRQDSEWPGRCAWAGGFACDRPAHESVLPVLSGDSSSWEQQSFQGQLQPDGKASKYRGFNKTEHSRIGSTRRNMLDQGLW